MQDQIICGDSAVELAKLEPESVDLLCTDPPYGYSFMGKNWDKAVPSVDLWKECLRVLKPGAFAFVMSAPRQDVLSQMIVRLTEAGFDTDFTSIYWTYASGFPKAMNIGKAVDKRNGRSSDDFYAFARYLKEQREAAGLTKADVDRACNIKSSCYIWEGDKMGTVNVPTVRSYRTLKSLLHLDNRFDELIEREEAEREVIGSRITGAAMSGHARGTESTFAASGTNLVDITAPATQEAKALDGSYGGFQPKPAVEIIIVAMKPLSEKTFVDQALKNQKGITWLDDCRIPHDGSGAWGAGTRPAGFADVGADKGDSAPNGHFHESGRFPANLLVSDDVLNDGSVSKSTNRSQYTKTYGHESATYMPTKPLGQTHADSGSFSRYFDLDKWAIDKLPKNVQEVFPFLIVPKAAKSEKGAENKHPTVKPLKLMSYLITLGSRPKDVVLDPFLGSGTTAIAAKAIGRHYIGIEREKEYCDIAEARLEYLTMNQLPFAA